MPSSARSSATPPISESVLRVGRLSSSLASFQSGPDAAEDLLVLDLAGHDGLGYAFAPEGLDQPREFAQRHPVHGDGAALLDLGKGLFLDGRDYDVLAARAGGVEHQEGKLAIAGDQSETGVHGTSPAAS